VEFLNAVMDWDFAIGENRLKGKLVHFRNPASLSQSQPFSEKQRNRQLQAQLGLAEMGRLQDVI